jgi:hypothetical protein
MGSSLWQANSLKSIQNGAGRLVVTGNSKKYRQPVVDDQNPWITEGKALYAAQGP